MSGHQEFRFSYRSAPTLRAFSESDLFLRGIMGPIGSGKSSGCVVEMIARAQAQAPGPDGIKRSRWLVVRNTYQQLTDTTIKTVHQWLPPMFFGAPGPTMGWNKSTHTYLITGFPGVEIEILFRALDRPDQVANVLSMELTGAWINEAREVPWTVIRAIQGRVGRFPAQRDGGPTWYGVIMDTNPPDTDSEWYQVFEEKCPDNAILFRQPSGISAEAENLGNLPKGYYSNLVANATSEEWVKVYVKGEYGFVLEGKPVFPEYNDIIHCRETKTINTEPVYRGWDFGLCYSDDTEVLTKAGWKLFKDVNVELDLILTRDPITGAMEYAKAAFKVCEPFNGEMLEWRSTEISMLVTPDHRIPYTNRESPNKVIWQSAEWLAGHMGGHHYVDLLAKWNAPDFDSNQRWFGLQATEWAEFLGIYLAEGSCDKKRVTIYQKTANPEIQRVLDATGWDWRWLNVPDGKAAGWRLYSPLLSAHLSVLGISGVKRVPPEIKAMPTDIIRKFINLYTIGDGHIRTRTNGAVEHTLFTISKNMAADMQELAQKAGWNSSLAWQKGQTSHIKEGATVRAIVSDGGYRITFKKTSSRAELLRRNFKRVPYNGMVYCLNVPHHTLYVRRHGKPHWNGNTPACVFSQLTPSGQWIIVDELVSEDMGIDRFSDTVIEHSTLNFPGREFIDIGDPAGNQRSQVDERTCFQILWSKGIEIEAGLQTEALRLECVRKPLSMLSGGLPRFVLHPRCTILRKGFMGGYSYRRKQVSGERYDPKPDKNRYSHPMDALQYVATRIFGEGLTTPKPSYRHDDDDLVFAAESRSMVTGY